MAERIYSDNASLYKNYRVANERMRENMTQLSTGKRITRPGDDSVGFDQVSSLNLDKSSGQAQLQALQSRTSWFQASTAYLTSIRELLTSMSENTIRAASAGTSTQDLAVLDGSFQEYKQEIAAIIDGNGGTTGPKGVFNGVPLFTGFLPDAQVGSDVPAGKLGQAVPSLYTGYGRDGFDTLPLHTGGAAPVPSHTATAQAGTATTITLGDGAAAIDDVYNGLSITITAGTGIGQTATITDYNSNTRIATLSAPLTTPPDATSVYQIDAQEPNNTVVASGTVTEMRIASWLWGADNSRGIDERHLFVSVTPEETAYRTANSIPDTDLEAKTYEERLARRMHNIFDSEYGTLENEGNIFRMQRQIEHAITQITQLVTDHGARAENMVSQQALFQKQQEAQELGIETFESVDPYKTAGLLSTVSVDPARIIELAARMTENLGKLNDLVRSGGTR